MSAITSRSETFTKIAKIEVGVGGILVVGAVALIILGNISSLALSSALLPGYIFVGVGGGVFIMGGITACCPPCCRELNTTSPVNSPTLISLIVYLPNKPTETIYISTKTIESLFPDQSENRTVEVAGKLYSVEEAPLLLPNQMGISDKEVGLKGVKLPVMLEASNERIVLTTHVKVTIEVPSKKGSIYVVKRESLEAAIKKFCQASKKNFPLTWVDLKLQVEHLGAAEGWYRITDETQFEFVAADDFYFTDEIYLASEATLQFTSERSNLTAPQIAQMFQKVPVQVDEISAQYVSSESVWRKNESKNRITLTGIAVDEDDEPDLLLIDTLDSPIKVKYTKKDEAGLSVVEKLERAGVAGLPATLNDIFQPVLDCQDAKEKGEHKDWDMHLDKGVLLVGPPGTGKTSIGRAIGEILELDESDIRYVKASDIMSKWHGESEGNVAKLFERSKNGYYFIILIDEIEGLTSNRDQMIAAHELKIVNEFLQQIDGMQLRDDFMIIGMTNKPDKMDGAFLRPGRFRRVDIGLPSLQSREQIFKHYLKVVEKFLDFKIDDHLSNFATWSEDCSGADIKDIIVQAKKRAFGVRRTDPKNAKVTLNDVKLAISSIVPLAKARAAEARTKKR